ncbi:MAG TPA: SemiSWEET family transporter [Candidatus Paceibacterota bacterium]|nr:SemiSWEET family transporter [Candidatus Paceibacterota bacterium]
MIGFDHHLHLRKRVYKKLEQYPNPDTLKRFLDKAMVFVGIAGPLAMLPQVYQVFATQDAKGLSIITWFIWTLTSALWLTYGVIHKETPIVVSNSIYIALHVTIVVAILVFG